VNDNRERHDGLSLTDAIFTAADETQGWPFDAFLADSPFAAYQQTRAWAGVAPSNGRHDFLFWRCSAFGRPVAAAVIRRTMLSPVHWLATLQRGPVVHDATMLAQVLPRLIETLGEHGACSVQLAPRVRGRDLPIMAEALRASGFTPLAEDRQPLHRATGIVWLDKPEDAVFAGFRQRGRRQVRAAEKAGISVRVVEGDADVATYQALIDEFRAARRDYDMSGLPDAAGQAALIAASGGAMLLAEKDGEAIGAHAFVKQADEAIWLSLATSERHPDLPRSYPLLWTGMRHAREMGLIAYDLAGMPLEDARDEGEGKRMQFKEAFAPTRRMMLPMQVAAVKPVVHAMLFSAREVYRGVKRRRRAAA
jgi:lipid II:glycine glycyltransferase (peptidoglycan interpeptide bridge formation enzyme)